MNVMRKSKHSYINYFKYTVREMFSTMPAELLLILLINLIVAIVSFGQVYIMAVFLDSVEKYIYNQITKVVLIRYAGLFMLSLVIPQLLELLKTYVNDVSVFKKSEVLTIRLYQKILSAPMICFDNSDFYNSLTRACSCVNSGDMLKYLLGFTNFLPLGARIIGVISIMASFHIAFVWIAAICILPTLISKMLYNRILHNFRHRQTPVARRRDYLWEILTSANSVKDMRTNGSESYFNLIWLKARDECLEQEFKVELKNTNLFMLCDIIKLAGFAVSIALAVKLIGLNYITAGQFSACVAAFGSLQAATTALVSVLVGQDAKMNHVKDYYDFLECIEEPKESESLFPHPGKENLCVEVKDVCFAYSKNGPYVLNNISFSFTPGERVVIVGENGSGKTTLSKIINGMYSPNTGEVLVNGMSVRNLKIGACWSLFSLVQQNYVCYNFSLRENIGLSLPNNELMMNDERIEYYAKLAGASMVLQKVGLDEQLGRSFGGTELSGGEWQKIAVARALNKETEIIILDEPTSALDPIVETKTLQQFIDITTGKTAIIISHRVGICKYADKIIVLKDGTIVEIGSHSDLLSKNGEYARLWLEQSKWYTD